MSSAQPSRPAPHGNTRRRSSHTPSSGRVYTGPYKAPPIGDRHSKARSRKPLASGNLGFPGHAYFPAYRVLPRPETSRPRPPFPNHQMSGPAACPVRSQAKGAKRLRRAKLRKSLQCKSDCCCRMPGLAQEGCPPGFPKVEYLGRDVKPKPRSEGSDKRRGKRRQPGNCDKTTERRGRFPILGVTFRSELPNERAIALLLPGVEFSGAVFGCKPCGETADTLCRRRQTRPARSRNGQQPDNSHPSEEESLPKSLNWNRASRLLFRRRCQPFSVSRDHSRLVP
jgi:hypothetical protein